MTAANAAPCAMEALRRKIGQRAYALWECEGKPCGSDLEHLCQAESEVMAGCCTASDATAPAETAFAPSARPCVQPRQMDLDIALGHKHFHARHSRFPSG